MIDIETGEKAGGPEPKKPELSRKNFHAYCQYFTALAKGKLGVEPEVGGLKDYKAFVEARKSYTSPQIQELTRFFFTLEKAKEFPTITACLSKHTRTMWNMQEAKFKQMNS